MAGDDLLDHRQADAVRGELVGVDVDADGGQRRANDLHLADAGDLRDALRDDSGGFVVEGGDVVNVRLKTEDENGGVSWVYLAVAGVGREIGGQVGAGGVDAGFDVAGGAVNIAAQIELEGDRGGAEGGGRGHLSNAGNVAELAFKGRRD